MEHPHPMYAPPVWLEVRYIIPIHMRKFETWLRNKARRTVDSFFCSSSPDVKRVGEVNSGWVIHTNPLPKVAYCAGVGKGMSFEIELARISNACVFVFDPSPTGISTVENTDTGKLKFYPVGMAAETAVYEFSLPESPEEGSYSVARDGLEKTTFECWSLQTIMQKHGHRSIDLLKMDIEGFEYDIIDGLLRSEILIRQLCVEFHPWLRPGRTFKTIRKLHKAGYRIIHKHRGDHTFLQCKR
jgi:FkbM family methyltransferase